MNLRQGEVMEKLNSNDGLGQIIVSIAEEVFSVVRFDYSKGKRT